MSGPTVSRGLDGRKIAAARLFASTRVPYLASALFALTVHPAPDCQTISVDPRWQIHADPPWVDRLEVDQLGRLLIHHVGHLLRGHADRAGQSGVRSRRDAGRWNRCADAEINDDLARDRLVPDVAPTLPSDLGCADGGLVEDYYLAADDIPAHWDCGSGCDNLPRPREGKGGQGIGREAGELLCLSVAADIQRHHRQRPGSVPGGWLRWAERVLPSRTDWRRALAAEVRQGVASVAGNVDYTYQRPSRRARLVPNIVLPSLHRPLPDVAIVCDTSGSMHEQLLGRALAEVEAILSRTGLRQAQVRVLAVDTNVHAVRRVSRAAQVHLSGGGGTDMGAGITAAAKLRPPPSVIVVLTDGFTPWPQQPPKTGRVVVGLLEQHTNPSQHFSPPAWARTIRIEPT
jgi:predicted metal-dependent peptidase